MSSLFCRLEAATAREGRTDHSSRVFCETEGLNPWREGSKTRCPETEGVSRSVLSDSLQPHGLLPTRLLCPGDPPGQNTGAGCLFLLQGIFLSQESKSGLPHCGRVLYLRGHQGSLWCPSGTGENSLILRERSKAFSIRIRSPGLQLGVGQNHREKPMRVTQEHRD